MAEETPIIVPDSGAGEAGAGAGGTAGAGIAIGQGMSIPFRPRRRPRRILRDNIKGITKPTIRRLARRGGIGDMEDEVYDTVRDVVKARVTEVIERLAILMRNPPVDGPEQLPPLEDGSKIVTTLHVVYVLKQVRW
ncbi:hypothetical protein HRR83_006018 [Exophiala dermatitidis]|nr:hypothetical protein HRR75_004965 [Exophiala dermatitidis]KAJ4514950.1 hypothetical protein HRR74_005415 [Exophiala dermatitidis]KAJ4517441.1 hypothetical protein HRR73_004493 [Exophiala dermatitidis]KAJ4550594.1 hypothetical protein HRR78_004363 [Exophiala dermatitidis]KAJ4552474.1 hypothetical protein HRR77_002483 [Exophiala dermatitidis]